MIINANNLIKHYCFDMDGTLVDSNKTIYNSTIITLEKLNIEHNIDELEFSKRIGQHFKDIFDEFEVTIPDFEEYIYNYKQVYMDQMSYSNLYDGVFETLKKIKESGALISLLTTKAQDQAEKIIEYFNLNSYFDYVMGRRDGMEHKPSPEPLIYICKKLNVSPSETLMIGDTELDIQCGKNAGSLTCAVLYGYRTKDQLMYWNPDFFVKNFSEIMELNKK